VKVAATTSPLDSTPDEIRPRLAVATPTPSLSAASRPAAATETSVVRSGVTASLPAVAWAIARG
jgi:hypothetical protein